MENEKQTQEKMYSQSEVIDILTCHRDAWLYCSKAYALYYTTSHLVESNIPLTEGMMRDFNYSYEIFQGFLKSYMGTTRISDEFKDLERRHSEGLEYLSEKIKNSAPDILSKSYELRKFYESSSILRNLGRDGINSYSEEIALKSCPIFKGAKLKGY
ncbi:MAG: hypothetical protein ACP5OG_03945 [Candidatus Nanoarchaeia archaeon]